MASVGSSNITFASLRTAYNSGGGDDATGDANLQSGSIKLADFRGATFTDGTSVPSSGEISIDDDFKGKTFGSASTSIVYNTGSFRVYDNWSAYPTKLKGIDGTSTFSGSTIANKRIRLYSGQSSAYPYPIILLTPNATNSSTSPGIIVDRNNANAVDEATVWFRVVSHNTYGQVQLGIVAKDMTVNNWTNQKGDLADKHATYCDRLGFHGYGYHNYAGSRDDITSGSTIVSPQYKTGTYGSSLTTNFHNRTGATAGTMRSANAVSAPTAGYTMYFFKNSYGNYSGYRSATLNPNHGLKVKWYETTLQVKLEDGSSNIVPVSGNWSASDLTDIFSGMYVSGTGIPTGDGAFIGDIHTNYMVLYKGKGSTALGKLNASSSLDLSNITLTISGYLYWTLTTGSDSSNSNTNYTNAKIFGPPHTVLPKYQAASSGSTTSVEIKEWAYYIGDTTSATSNYFDYDLRHTDPGGTAFSYSVTYGTGTIPAAGSYEYAMNDYTTLADPLSGTLSGVSPSYSGISLPDPPYWRNIAWHSYSMGHKYKFLVSGKIVAIGTMNRYRSRLALFLDGGSTAVATADAWSWSTDTADRYRYVTLSTPRTVSANQSYWVMVKNYSGGYSGHRYNLTPFPAPVKTTASGNIQFTETGFINSGRGDDNSSSQASRCLYPTTVRTTLYLYGNTDIIFLPD
jgi:hypothetical protein